MNKKSNLTCGICDFCEHLNMDENQSTCNYLNKKLMLFFILKIIILFFLINSGVFKIF